jgi:glucose/mannose-6-phosphate isomerase
MGHLAPPLDRSNDPQDMLGTVVSSPEQWRHALALATDGPAPVLRAPRAVVVAGMGGSGIAGDVAAVVAADRGSCPVVPSKGYELPGWVGPEDLVVAASYSGNTEETLAGLDAAEAAGASVFAVTSGGVVAERAAASDWPVVTVPGGRQPRASLAYLAVPTLVALERAGALAPGVADELAGVADHLDGVVAAHGPDSPEDVGAKAVATALAEHLPVVYGGRGLPALVASRAKCQVNENAKRAAWSNELPELDHNEVVGYDRGAPGTSVGLWLVRSAADEHPQTTKRFAATLEVIDGRYGALVETRLVADTPLRRLAEGVLQADLVSVYLAHLAGVDPTPVGTIEELKHRIAA